MMGRWVEVDQDIASEMKKMLPSNIEKNVAYDVVKQPMKYLESNLTMSQLVGVERDAPRTSSIPCHSKFDMDAAMFITCKDREGVVN